MATAQQVYSETVQTMTLSERLRLAAMILENLSETAAPVLDYSDTWTDEDVRDLTAHSLAYADSLYPEETEIA